MLPVGGVDEEEGAAPPPGRVPGMVGLLGSLRGQGCECPCAVSCVRHWLSGVLDVEVAPCSGMVSTGILGGVLPCAWAAVPMQSANATSDAMRRGRAVIVVHPCTVTSRQATTHRNARHDFRFRSISMPGHMQAAGHGPRPRPDSSHPMAMAPRPQGRPGGSRRRVPASFFMPA